MAFEPWLCALLALSFPLSGYRPALVQARQFRLKPKPSPLAQHTMELRVDVQLAPGEVDDELKLLHARLEGSGLLANGTQVLPIHSPGLVFRHREADGEHYVYAQDLERGCLAGYTVFNRLIEVNRRMEKFVRAPHSKYASDYQQRGIATSVYEWALGQGFCLISGARQSPGASALWQKLGARHRLEYVDLANKHINLLGTQVDQATQDSLQTRMLLLGQGWRIDVGKGALVHTKPPAS